MTDHMPDGLSAAGRDLRAYTDHLRPKHPVVRNTNGEWVLLRHADVLAAALDQEHFSSQVSHFLQIPNGLDGQEHTLYRTIVEHYLSQGAVEPFVPVFKKIASQLAASLPRGEVVDAVNDIGAVFAVRAQCAWLGWPTELEPRLLDWMKDNHAATRSGNRSWMAEVAGQFDDIIRSVIQPRRSAGGIAPDDLTTKLCRQKVNGRLLTEAELVSILRNWTGGDLGSIALCVGVLISHLAKHPARVARIREGSDTEVEAIINEILRLDNPFVSNRRITTCPVEIAGQKIPKGEKVKLNWTSANRDEAVFDNNCFNPEAHAASNLLYGAGKHTCPGQLLATWELRIALKSILKTVQSIRFAPGETPEREVAPVGGYRRVPILIT
ncbi:hypothetical protein MARI_15680 [Marinobacter sp. JH2]|nr:cytochrome P450 [Marinobacter sp. JH2]QBM17453.1 hypothetical protein MARI_15680 [Marinobacter sp. JH2]